MRRTRVLTFLNNKGGVGKTTSCINLSAALAELGKSVLLIDSDSQRNATTHVASELMTSGAMSFSPFMINDGADISEAVVKTRVENLDMIMADRDIQISVETYHKRWARPSERLKEKLEVIDGLVDYIIIDTPPELSLTVENALAASTHFIVPVDQGGYAEMGLTNLHDRLLKKIYQINPDLVCLGVLPVMMKKNTAIDKNITEKDNFGEELFKKLPISIPHRQAIVNNTHTGFIAVSKGSKCDVAEAYRELAKYVEQHTKTAEQPSASHGVQ